MPNKTIYVRDEDARLWELAERLSGGSVSSLITEALRRYVAQHRPNSVTLPTGRILVVRYAGKYGAIKAIDQASEKRGGFIRYAWWYQPDGSGSFISSTAETGYGETRDYVPTNGEPGIGTIRHTPSLEIGPIELEWSMASDGYGYVYNGPPGHHSEEYELGLTNDTDISRVDGARLDFPQWASPNS
jgi:hypothetical protein